MFLCWSLCWSDHGLGQLTRLINFYFFYFCQLELNCLAYPSVCFQNAIYNPTNKSLCEHTYSANLEITHWKSLRAHKG